MGTINRLTGHLKNFDSPTLGAEKFEMKVGIMGRAEFRSYSPNP